MSASNQDNGTIKYLIVDPPVGNRFYRLFKPSNGSASVGCTSYSAHVSALVARVPQALG